MSYLPSRHNLTSRITASLLVILYILTLGPLKETLASVIPQSPLPVPILSSQITTGRIPNTNNSSLLSGWQMLGYPSKNRTKVSDALANLIKGTNYDRISRYDKAANTFVDLASTDYLEPGVAYFIRVLKNSTWTVLPKPDVTDLTEFVYDAAGKRVKRIANGTATIYIEGLYEKTGSTVTKHIFAGANRVATVSLRGSPAEGGRTEAISYYHSDHLGSSNVITNSTGAHVQLAEYKPYGTLSRDELANPQTSLPVNYYFTGKELDPTGLYYYGARYYDPKIGRFITPDPIIQDLYDPQNLNSYTYCRNNPLRYIDPTGEAFGDNMYSNSRNFWLGDNPKGFASGVFNTLVAASSATLGVAMLPGAFLATPFMGALGWVAGVTGSASLGLSTGAGLTGRTITGRLLSDYERGELLGSSAVGWGLLGVGAWANGKYGAIPKERSLSPYRLTHIGEEYIRFESTKFDSKISTSGVLGDTYAAKLSERIPSRQELNALYNLPKNLTPRDVYYRFSPKSGQWILGPRPVSGGAGDEVYFSFATEGNVEGPYNTP